MKESRQRGTTKKLLRAATSTDLLRKDCDINKLLILIGDEARPRDQHECLTDGSFKENNVLTINK